jgi:hypothetical protein
MQSECELNRGVATELPHTFATSALGIPSKQQCCGHPPRPSQVWFSVLHVKIHNHYTSKLNTRTIPGHRSTAKEKYFPYKHYMLLSSRLS